MTQSRTGEAVAYGLSGMLGAGIFLGIAPAAAAAGTYALVGVVLAGIHAACSAFSTADQARSYPGPGSGYRYAREQLGRWPARMAASLYLVGRIIAGAAIARTTGAYLAPDRSALLAIGVLAASVALTLAAFRLTPLLSRVSVSVVLLVLGMAVVTCFTLPPSGSAVAPVGELGSDDPRGILTAAGVMVFAFFGFERITEFVRGQAKYSVRQLQVAIPIMLGVAVATYLLVDFAALSQLGPTRLALSPAPLMDAITAAAGAWLAPLLALGISVAAVSVLVPSFGTTTAVLGVVVRDGDLPRWAARPKIAVGCLGVFSALVAVLIPPAAAIGMAACCLLFYYAFTHASARLLCQRERAWPTRTACVGLGLSVLFGMAMPALDLIVAAGSVVVGTLVFAGYSNRPRFAGYRPHRDRDSAAP